MNKKLLTVGALSIATVIGATLGSIFKTVPTFAADTPAAAVTPTQQTNPPGDLQFDSSRGGHVGQDGKREELLTGETAEKVKAAALAALPGGSIERVETDAEGSPYEAHMKKADGTRVTLKFDSNFTVTATETGPKK